MCSLTASSLAIYPAIPCSKRSEIWGTKKPTVTNCSFPLRLKPQRLYIVPLVAKISPKYFPRNPNSSLWICKAALNTTCDALKTKTIKRRPISPIYFPPHKSLPLYENRKTDNEGGGLPPGGGGGGLFRYFRGGGGGGIAWLGIFFLLCHLVYQCLMKNEEKAEISSLLNRKKNY